MEFVSQNIDLLPRNALEVLSRDELAALHCVGSFRAVMSSERLRVGVIGTRSPSQQSRDAIRVLAGKVSRHGSIVVSGAALGTDMAAQLGAIDVGGTTIACVPFGLDGLNIADWRPDFATGAAEENLLLLSIFDPRKETDRQTPVVRNRLIAALSEVLVVGEAASASGTFHCVAKAQKLGVPIFFLKYEDILSGGNPDLARLHRNLERLQMTPFYLDECDNDQLCRRIYERGMEYRREMQQSERAQADLFDLDEL